MAFQTAAADGSSGGAPIAGAGDLSATHRRIWPPNGRQWLERNLTGSYAGNPGCTISFALTDAAGNTENMADLAGPDGSRGFLDDLRDFGRRDSGADVPSGALLPSPVSPVPRIGPATDAQHRGPHHRLPGHVPLSGNLLDAVPRRIPRQHLRPLCQPRWQHAASRAKRCKSSSCSEVNQSCGHAAWD
jgi:hypothetical protein